jgi:hypothetical protein
LSPTSGIKSLDSGASKPSAIKKDADEKSPGTKIGFFS